MLRLGMAGALVVSLGIALLSFSTYGQASALLGHQACYHDLYFERNLDPKVVIIGSSRIRRGLDPTIMADQMGTGKDSVVNLGHPLGLPLFDHSVLSDMFEDGRLGRDTDVLIVEAITISQAQLEIERRGAGQEPNQDFTISSGQVQDGFISGGSAKSLFDLARHQDPGLAMAVWNFMRLVSARIEAHVKLAIRGRSTFDVFVPSEEIDHSRKTICFATRWHQKGVGGPREAGKKAYYKAYFEGKPATGDLDPHDFLTNQAYTTHRLGLRSIVQMAQTRGITVYAYYSPGVFTPQLPNEFRAKFEAEIGIPLLTLPQDIRAELGEAGYFDHTHLTVSGRSLVSKWLADQIKNDLTQ